MPKSSKAPSLDDKYKNNINLSYEYVEKSLKEVQDISNHTNTQLGLIIGFNFTFIRFFLNELPGQIINLESLPCHSCLLLKILAYLFSFASISLSFLGLYKTIDYFIIKPDILMQNCDRASNVELKSAILDTWKKKLDNFITLVKYKKQIFNYAIICILISGLLATLNKITAAIFY